MCHAETISRRARHMTGICETPLPVFAGSQITLGSKRGRVVFFNVADGRCQLMHNERFRGVAEANN